MYVQALGTVELVHYLLRNLVTLVNNLQESYVEIEKAIRSLAGFYSKAGPSAALPEEVKSEILNDLNSAEEFL